MKLGRWLVLGLCLFAGRAALAQVDAYADFSASKLTNLDSTRVFYGPTIGVSAHVASPAHMRLSGDIRATLYGGSNHLYGLAVGPKVSFLTHRLQPYAEFLVGYARYNDGLGRPSSGTTDAQLQVNFGVDRAVTHKFDWRVFEFGYEQYYALGGQFNPKTFSTGVVYHLGRR